MAFDLDDQELEFTKKLQGLISKQDKLIESMAIDLFYGREYLQNVFTIDQLIDCYKRKIEGDTNWSIGRSNTNDTNKI